jgi:hypothetical protein
LGHEQLTLQLATEPTKGQEQDVEGPASVSTVAAPTASVEVGDAGGGEDPPQAVTQIVMDAMAAPCPATFL